MSILLLVSGPMAVGKSAVAKALIEEHRFQSIKSSQFLRDMAKHRGLGESRTDLQALGDSLDELTDYKWLIDDVAVPAIEAKASQERWLLDAVRKKRQVEHFRTRFGKTVFHAHLSAPELVIEKRYNERLSAGGEHPGNTDYAAAKAHPNEIASRSLIEVADIFIDLEHTSSQAAASTILEKWKERGGSCDK
jgi:hypothetical protein